MYEYQYSNSGNAFRLGRGCKIILIVTAAAYLVQIPAEALFGRGFNAIFGLSLNGIRSLYLWQLVTYMFLHGNIWHILFNMLLFYFMGRDIEDVLGTARFVFLYLACGIFGGILWLVFAGAHGYCIGASGGVFGLIGAFGAIFAARRITLLIFLIPITMTGRTMAICAVVITLLMMIHGGSSGIAHLAHLGGGVAGYAYGWWVKKKKGFLFGTEWSQWTPFKGNWPGRLMGSLRRRNVRLMDPAPDYVPDKDEVDAILEKVSKFGVGGLTRWEEQILKRAGKNGVKR